MSRSGYSDDCDGAELNPWRGAVASAIRGKRGQAMLRELLSALDALPEKRLAPDSLVTDDGEYCALGALGRARGISMVPSDPEDVDPKEVARAFGIAPALAAEVMFLNDEHVQAEKLVKMEICGPVRPYYPEYGEHKKWVRMPVPDVAEKRWAYMRAWVQSQITASPVPQPPDTQGEQRP